MSTHDYHDALPGYDPRQILVAGCGECERRGKNVAVALEHLDSQRFLRAWRRAYDLHASQGNPGAVGPVSSCERPLLSALWGIEIQLERLGEPLTGWPPVEIWEPISGYEKRYEISNRGRVRALFPAKGYPTPRMLSPVDVNGGYLRVTLSDGHGDEYTAYVHRLVLEAFEGPCPAGMETRHLDGDPGNCVIANLKWGTPTENAQDRVRHGTALRGERHPQAKLTESQVREIRARRLAGEQLQALANEFGVSDGLVGLIAKGHVWRHLAEDDS